MKIRRQSLGDDSPILVINLTGLAEVLNLKEHYSEAEAVLQEALAIGRSNFPDGHWRINFAETVLAENWIATGRYEEAEPLLRTGHQVVVAARGERSPVAKQTLRRLVRLYESWGRPDEAARFQDELDRLQESKRST